MIVKLFSFPVWYAPKAWSRVTPKGRGRVYKDRRQKDAEAAVRAAWLDHLRHYPEELKLPYSGPVRARVVSFFARPKSATKADVRTTYADGAPCDKHKGDVDNLAKTVLDALNPSGRSGVLPRIYAPWEDDAQVFSLISEKRWTVDRDYIHVTLQFCTFKQRAVAEVPVDFEAPVFSD
jgi:Holliday junction resolvase RusA-like endonuclease